MDAVIPCYLLSLSVKHIAVLSATNKIVSARNRGATGQGQNAECILAPSCFAKTIDPVTRLGVMCTCANFATVLLILLRLRLFLRGFASIIVANTLTTSVLKIEQHWRMGGSPIFVMCTLVRTAYLTLQISWTRWCHLRVLVQNTHCAKGSVRTIKTVQCLPIKMEYIVIFMRMNSIFLVATTAADAPKSVNASVRLLSRTDCEALPTNIDIQFAVGSKLVVIDLRVFVPEVVSVLATFWHPSFLRGLKSVPFARLLLGYHDNLSPLPLVRNGHYDFIRLAIMTSQIDCIRKLPDVIKMFVTEQIC